MRKSLLKSLVAVAVVGATMAITSVAAMAATYEFKLGENDVAGKGKVAATYGTIFETCDGSAKAAVDANPMPSEDNPASFWGIDESDSFTHRYKTGGTLAEKSGAINCGIKFTIDEESDITIVYRSGSNGEVRSIGVYPYTKSLSKDAVLSFSNDGNGAASETNVYKKTGTLDPGTYVIGGTGGAVNIYYIKVETAAADTPALTEGSFPTNYGTVVVKGTDAYLIGEYTLNSTGTLSIGDQTFTTDTVYTSVQLAGDTNPLAAEKDGTYYYAVKVTDLTSNDQVAALMNFTVA